MEAKQIKVQLVKESDKKHSVRYIANNQESENNLTAIYLMNKAVQELGTPRVIEVTITAIEG